MIRAATLADVPRLVTLGRAFLQTPPYAGLFTDDPDQLAATVTALITEDRSAVLVLDDGTTIAGMIGLIAAPHFLARDVVAGEVFWYVDPAARGGGIRLWRAAEAWAVAKGAVTMQMIAPATGDPDDRLAAVYVRRGYTVLETNYIRRLDAA